MMPPAREFTGKIAGNISRMTDHQEIKRDAPTQLPKKEQSKTPVSACAVERLAVTGNYTILFLS
jgi:hypothetical protein